MFVVLDTNHFAELVHDTGCGARLKQRFAKHRAEVLTTIITAQEVSEGWSAFIRKQKAGSEKQIHGYSQFQHSLAMLMELTVLPFDEQAAAVFRDLRKHLPQAGTQDLKIAAIGIAHDATVLTRNLVHFTKVPGLRVENWLD
ncbi:type II toxin-antitoxin system VapC family toxin [Prosthecobacter sp.]|uniref:type II toxin-antitoxin system VapC family toxin n=1 Tax=Prosthecobacter sp. TaxID=1965333 RepID=UPI0024898647|nr:type II toxin-antitoxin system VapC family toxin [Prosthecobacter sp.]MDI1313111.1 type II toxin-antitoxin system VapC family toxin [Prosthecobacter sp.]